MKTHPIIFTLYTIIGSMHRNVDSLRSKPLLAKSATQYGKRIVNEALTLSLFNVSKQYNAEPEGKFLNFAASYSSEFRELINSKYDYFFVITSSFSETYRSLRLDEHKGLTVINLGAVTTSRYGEWSAFMCIRNEFLDTYWKTIEDIKVSGIAEGVREVEFLETLPKLERYYGPLSRLFLVQVIKTLLMNRQKVDRSSIRLHKTPKSLSFLKTNNKNITFFDERMHKFLHFMLKICKDFKLVV